MGNTHPTSNYWSTGEERTRIECHVCGVRIEGITYAADFGCGTPQKCFFFYEFSSSDISTTVGGGVSAEKGPHVGGSVTIKSGTPLIKFFRMDGQKHVCTACFAKENPDILKSIALTVNGKAGIINSDMTLNAAAYGN